MAYFQPEGQIATSLTIVKIKAQLPIPSIIKEVEELLLVAANETISPATAWVQK
ncbi:Hypothetical protein FKW44_007294 [Caligus rogercresseyi]|uniref:Uncharacterized protein n=1 Tax=Caligus rogercresseyi TaxID=217165 RepID=A0A7T8QTG0_CALRO|nr:Hypothetical protein FKW44_007294 [Caligus rogercresseyi]